MLHRVHFRKENLTVHVPDGENLREACLASGIDPYPALGGLLSCRGHGFCGTCAVVCEPEEALAPAEKREAGWLKGKGGGRVGLRLSCQARVKGDVTIETDPDPKPAWRTHGYYSGRHKHAWEASS